MIKVKKNNNANVGKDEEQPELSYSHHKNVRM